jgi:RNA polymerase sigma-70 factor (ECF subfamily)
VLVRLGSEYTADGKTETFELLRHFIGLAASDVTYAKVATALEMTEGAVKVAAHRLRRRYRELIREELAQTLADPSDIEDEIAWLFKVLA